jgi:hypothetical protein
MRRKIRLGKAFSLKAEVDEDAQGSTSSPTRARRVAVGKELDADIVVVRNQAESDAGTRRQIAQWICALSTFFLIAAAALGVYRSEFSVFQSVWNGAGPVFGIVLTYFFAPSRSRKS